MTPLIVVLIGILLAFVQPALIVPYVMLLSGYAIFFSGDSRRKARARGFRRLLGEPVLDGRELDREPVVPAEWRSLYDKLDAFERSTRDDRRWDADGVFPNRGRWREELALIRLTLRHPASRETQAAELKAKAEGLARLAAEAEAELARRQVFLKGRDRVRALLLDPEPGQAPGTARVMTGIGEVRIVSESELES